MLKSHRLFIGNIPEGTTENELSAEFGAYGAVESIEIKTKRNPLDESVDTFGFVTLRVDDNTASACIKEFKEQKYKGAYLNVSKAKESFLDRLKREREEADARKQSTAPVQAHKTLAEVEGLRGSSKPLPTLPTLRKQDESSSSESSSESESEEEAEEPRASRGKTSATQDETGTSKPPQPKPQDELVKKWNQETYIEHGKLKIIPITGQVTEVIDRTKPHLNRSVGDKQLGGKARIADEKRKQGLTKLQSAYDKQKLAIKSALSGDSLNSKRKFTFSDDEDGSTVKKKLTLFDAQEDNDKFEGNFTVRNQLAGDEGQKLHEMQTTYHVDSRFRMDSRFLDNGGKAIAARKPTANGNEKERAKQLEILSNVTGKQIMGAKRNEGEKTPQMQRFDPSRQDKRTTEEEAREEMGDSKMAERREEESFKVTDEKFYSVSKNLSSLIGAKKTEAKEEFSLLSMFGVATEDDQHEAEVSDHDADAAADEDKPLKSDARFKYESSDSEEEEEEEQQVNHNDANINKREETSPPEAQADSSWADSEMQRKDGYYSKQGIWKRNFFFVHDDARFDDGRKFFGIHSMPPAVERALGTAGDGAADKQKKSSATEIRKIFKKRRQREGISIRNKSKLGFKMMKKKTFGK